MARMYKALCLRDTAQDIPYQYFKAGVEYVIPEDCPVAKHFQRVGSELSAKEADRVVEEGELRDPDNPNKRIKAVRKGMGYAEAKN